MYHIHVYHIHVYHIHMSCITLYHYTEARRKYPGRIAFKFGAAVPAEVGPARCKLLDGAFFKFYILLQRFR